MLSGEGNENSQKISRSNYRASDRSGGKKVKFRGIFRNKIAENWPISQVFSGQT